MSPSTNEDMPKLLRTTAALLACAALTTTPALAAEPVTASAQFEQALVNLPPLAVAGELEFTETEDGIAVKGVFTNGFALDDPAEYKLVVVDPANKVIVDFTEEFAEVAEIDDAAVEDFEFTTKTKSKIDDIAKEDAVVYQKVKIGNLELYAETGRAEVKKD